MSVFVYGEREVAYLRGRDAKLAAVMDRLGHIERQADDDLFSAVARHVIGQQISNRAQATIWRRFTGALGTVRADTVAAAGPASLQALGLSARKAGYLTDFAKKVLAGEFDLAAIRALGDAEAIRALTSLKGVGPWTAEMILLFCLQRPDILSFGDLGIQRGLCLLYGHRAITPRLFAKYRRRFSPCGSVASLYLWAVAGGQ